MMQKDIFKFILRSERLQEALWELPAVGGWQLVVWPAVHQRGSIRRASGNGFLKAFLLINSRIVVKERIFSFFLERCRCLTSAVHQRRSIGQASNNDFPKAFLLINSRITLAVGFLPPYFMPNCTWNLRVRLPPASAGFCQLPAAFGECSHIACLQSL